MAKIKVSVTAPAQTAPGTIRTSVNIDAVDLDPNEAPKLAALGASVAKSIQDIATHQPLFTLIGDITVDVAEAQSL